MSGYLKAYDKWWKKVENGTVIATESIWREALRWALTQETDLQQTELGAAIRKELNEETENEY